MNGNKKNGKLTDRPAKSRTEKCPEKADDTLQEPSAAATYMQNPAQARDGEQLPDAERTQGTGDQVISSKNPDKIPEGDGYTEADYFALPDDVRAELIDGRFFKMDSPSKVHQKVAFEIAKQIDDCIDEHEAPCFLYIAPSDVALGDKKDTIVQPDLYVHCDRAKEKKTGPHRGSPDLAVEVLSPSNPEHDLWRKRELYRRHGIREYWIIDPSSLKVFVFDFEKGDDPVKYSFDDTVPVRLSQGTCAVDFRRVHRKIRHLLEEG